MKPMDDKTLDFPKLADSARGQWAEAVKSAQGLPEIAKKLGSPLDELAHLARNTPSRRRTSDAAQAMDSCRRQVEQATGQIDTVSKWLGALNTEGSAQEIVDNAHVSKLRNDMGYAGESLQRPMRLAGEVSALLRRIESEMGAAGMLREADMARRARRSAEDLIGQLMRSSKSLSSAAQSIESSLLKPLLRASREPQLEVMDRAAASTGEPTLSDMDSPASVEPAPDTDIERPINPSDELDL
jgi:hypothetical protein